MDKAVLTDLFNKLRNIAPEDLTRVITAYADVKNERKMLEKVAGMATKDDFYRLEAKIDALQIEMIAGFRRNNAEAGRRKKYIVRWMIAAWVTTLLTVIGLHFK